MESFEPLSHARINNLSTPNLRFIGNLGVFQYIVDNIMLSNYHTLRYVASSLDSKLKGARVASVFSQTKNELVVSFGNHVESLIVSCEPHANALYLHTGFTRARTNAVDLFPDAIDATVVSTTMHPSDRIVTLKLDVGLSISGLFFGAKANVLLIGPDGKVRDSFKEAKKLVGTEPQFRDGELVYDLTLLDAAVKANPELALSAIIKKAFPSLGNVLVEEVLHRSGMGGLTSASEYTDETSRSILSSLQQVLQELASPRPRVYIEKIGEDRPRAFSLIPLHHLSKLEPREFDSIHDAIRYVLSRQRATDSLTDGRSAIALRLRRFIEKARRTLKAIEDDLHDTARANEYERFGSLLMTHLRIIEKGAKAVNVPDESSHLTIPLDGRLTPAQNAQRYFEKAKKSRLAYQRARERLQNLRASSGRAGTLLDALALLNTKAELKVFTADNADALEEFGIGEKSKEREQRPFRIFTVDGGFEVWAGKSSANNDLLTLKYAKPNDLWFHARGSSGSHVVLRVGSGKGEPGKKAREQAAGIAAYYSRMKNAKMVPVAMTEKKYVRKPKGAPPGTVVLEREKVIFAEPALPVDNRP